MPSNSWLNGWLTGDVWSAAEFSKSMGGFYSTTLGSAAASIDITSVPTWGTHLKIFLVGRGTDAATSSTLRLRVNGLSTNIYYTQLLRGTAATAVGAEYLGGASAQVGNIPAASATANLFSQHEITISWFRAAAFNPTIQSQSFLPVAYTTGNLYTDVYGGMVATVAAITRITLFPSAGNFDTGTRCTAYVIGP